MDSGFLLRLAALTQVSAGHMARLFAFNGIIPRDKAWFYANFPDALLSKTVSMLEDGNKDVLKILTFVPVRSPELPSLLSEALGAGQPQYNPDTDFENDKD